MVIHPTAIVEPGATIGEGVEIGPYSIIESDVVIGENTRIATHVLVKSGTRIGSGCSLHANCVIGDLPQYLGFDTSKKTGVVVGDNCTFREGVTVHTSIYDGKNTIIGNGVLLMVYSHVAHDCVLADNVVLTNNVMLAGHVEIGKNVYVGGGAAIHQFVRIGEGSMVGGIARVTKDIAPFLMVTERDEVNGLNLVGLKRRNIPRESIKDLKDLFHLLFEKHGNIREQAQAELDRRGDSASREVRIFLEFFGEGKRGFCGVDLKRKAE